MDRASGDICLKHPLDSLDINAQHDSGVSMDITINTTKHGGAYSLVDGTTLYQFSDPDAWLYDVNNQWLGQSS